MPKVQKKNNRGIVLIKKSNNLVESRYKFDIWETRFFLSILSKIQKDNTDFGTYRIRYKEVIQAFGLKSGDAYASLREAAKSLIRKTVQTSYFVDGVQREEERSLISKIDYLSDGQAVVESHGYIDVVVHEEMKPLLLQLSKNFTAYDLRNVAQLGVYSIRLYELLKQYESVRSRTLKVDDMKTMFELTVEYPKYNDFYRWVIKPSEIEINKYTDISIVEVEKLKEGRKVIALHFKFRAKTEQELAKMRGISFQETLLSGLSEAEIGDMSEEIPKQLKVVVLDKKTLRTQKNGVVTELIEDAVTEDMEAAQSKEQDLLISELSPIVVTQFGVSFKMFVSLVEAHPEMTIRRAVQVTEKAMKAGKIENAAGFFVGAVRNNYQDVKTQKKEVEAEKIVEKKAKVEAVRRVEEALQQQKEQAIRHEANRKMAIIKELIEADSPVMRRAIEELSKGMFSKGYDATKTIEENLNNAMFVGGLMNSIQKIDPSVFLA